MPFSAAVIIGSALSPRLGRRLSARAVMTGGLAVLALAMLLASGIRSDGGLAYLIACLSLSGLGLGAAAVASTGLGTSALAGDRQGLASGLINTSTQLGTALGVAAFVTLAAAYTRASAGDAASDADV